MKKTLNPAKIGPEKEKKKVIKIPEETRVCVSSGLRGHCIIVDEFSLF
jgi:hypothetical protein